MSFNYKQLKINDMVEVVIDIARDPQTGKILMHDVHPGSVVKAYHDGADILLNSPSLGQILIEWCLHIDDDRCAEIGPVEERIQESRDVLTNRPGSGVFRLSRNQQILIGLEDRLISQQQLLDALVVRVATLEDQFKEKVGGNKSATRKTGKQLRSASEVRQTSEPAIASP